MAIISHLSQAFAGRVIHHEDLSIRLLQRGDLEELAEWPSYTHELAWANFPATTYKLREQWYSSQQTMADSIAWFTVCQNRQMVGRTSLICPADGDDLIFGIVLRKDLLNHGLGTRAVQLMLQLTFTTIPQAAGMWLESQINNLRACRVWEKLGFVRESIHYRREATGKYAQYVGYHFSKDQAWQVDGATIEQYKQ